jgi:hypothetical protein
MGSYVNSHAVLIGSNEALSKAEKMLNENISKKYIEASFNRNGNRIDFLGESRSDPNDNFMRAVKHICGLDYVFFKGMDYDGYEVAYFYELDDPDNMQEFETQFNDLFNEYEDDDDTLVDKQSELSDKIDEDFEKYIQNYIRK